MQKNKKILNNKQKMQSNYPSGYNLVVFITLFKARVKKSNVTLVQLLVDFNVK